MAKSGYDFYLKKCLLPIAPKQLQIKVNNGNKTMSLINEGQINILKQPELTDIEFECLIPQIRYPFSVYKSGFKNAKYFLDYFEKMKNSRRPFQFIVSRRFPSGRSMFSTNIKVSMEDYRITEDAGEGFDLKVKVSLKQYRPYSTKTVKIIQETETPAATVEEVREATDSPAPETQQTYTVVKGDCLWNIAKKIYGNGSLYTKIHDANRDKVSNPNKIYPGQILTIPAA